MNPRPLAVALVLLLAQGCARLVLPPDEPLVKPLPYHGASVAYPSGMRLVVHEEPQAGRVEMTVSYRVGATDEPAGKEGLAHLVKHLTFRARHGGDQVPQVWSRLSASGAEFNAFTTHDSTDYWFVAPMDQFPELVRLEAQRLREPLAGLTEEDFRVERDVVVAELLGRYETSRECAGFASALTELLPGHPYGRTVDGTLESVRRITLEDARAFVKRHYTPAHVVAVVSGPLSSKEMSLEVERGFDGLTGLGAATSTPPVQRTPPPFPSEPKGMVTTTGPGDHPRLWMMWTVPGTYSGKTAQARAAAALLELVVERDMSWNERVHSANAFPMELDGVTLLVAAIDLRRAEDAQAVAALVEDKLLLLGMGGDRNPSMRRPNAVDALARVRNQLLTGTYLDRESLSTLEVARYLRATGQPDYAAGWEKQIREGLAGSFESYVHAYLQRGRARLLLVEPEKAGGGRRVVVAHYKALPGAEDFSHWDGPLPPGPHDVRRVALPPGLDKAERFTLPSGLKVVALRRGGLPLVDVRLWVDMGPGASGESAMPELALYSSWFSVDEAWNHASSVGARVSRCVEDDSALLAYAASSGNLPHLLDDLRMWVANSMVEHRTFARLREWRAHELELEAVRVDLSAWRVLNARLYPGHAYGDWPTPQQVRALTPSLANTWLAQRLHPWNMTLVLAGDLPPDKELRRWVEGLMRFWSSPPAREQRPAPASPALPEARTVVLLDRPGLSQAMLQLGLRWPMLDAGQEATADALTWLLDERLRHQLREELGLTDNVQAWRDTRPLATTLHVDTVVDAKAGAGALVHVLARLGALAATPLPPDVVERARWQVARRYDLNFRTVSSVASRLVELERLGRSPDYWERYPEHLAAVTPDSIQALVRQLSLGREVVVITGDAALLKPQLTAAGFKVEVLVPEPAVPTARASAP